MRVALKDWPASLDSIPARSQAIHSAHITPSGDLPVEYINRSSHSPLCPSLWPALEPRQPPRRRFHRRRQIFEVRFLRSAKGHLLPHLQEIDLGALNRAKAVLESAQPRDPSKIALIQLRCLQKYDFILSCYIVHKLSCGTGSTESTSASQQRSQAQAIDRTSARSQRRRRPEATTDITSAPYRRRV